MPGTTITLEQLEVSLTKMRDEISKQVPELVKAESTAANKEITALKTSLEDLDKGLKAVNEQIKKAGAFGMPGSETEKYKGQTFSITKFARALFESAKMARGMLNAGHDPWSHASLEKDICKQYMDQRQRDLTDGQAVIKDYQATDGSEGGFLIPPEITQQIIDTVWPQMPIMNMPVMKIEGLRGELPVPSITAKAQGYHVGENGRPAKSEGALGLRWLRPKKVAAFSKQSQRLLYQTSGVSDKIISYLLSQGLAVEFNRGLTNGVGSNSEPKGLLQYTGMTTVSSPISNTTLAIGSNGGRFTIDNAAQLQSALAAADELRDTQTYGFLMRPEVLWGMKRERVQMYSGASSKAGLPVNPLITLMSDDQIKNALGYPFKHTTQIPANTTKGTSSTCSTALFGDWSLFWTAFWRDLEFKVSDVAADGQGGSAFLDDQLYMVVFQEYDCQLMRETAFSKITDCETNENNW